MVSFVPSTIPDSSFAGHYLAAAVEAVDVSPLHFLIMGGCLARVVIKSRRHPSADFAQPFQTVIRFRFRPHFPAVGAGSQARVGANRTTPCYESSIEIYSVPPRVLQFLAFPVMRTGAGWGWRGRWPPSENSQINNPAPVMAARRTMGGSATSDPSIREKPQETRRMNPTHKWMPRLFIKRCFSECHYLTARFLPREVLEGWGIVNI